MKESATKAKEDLEARIKERPRPREPESRKVRATAWTRPKRASWILCRTWRSRSPSTLRFPSRWRTRILVPTGRYLC